MGMTKLPLADATAAQLKRFAMTHLGIEIEKTANKAASLAQITPAWEKDFILFDDTPLDENKEQSERIVDPKADPMMEKVTVNIAIQDIPGGTDAVPVGVNGRINLYARGQEVEMPYPYYEALMHAVNYRYEMNADGKSMNPIPRAVPAFPVTLIRGRPYAPLKDQRAA